MGNGNYRPTADFFQAPTMPSEVDLSAMVMSSAASSYRMRTSSVEVAGHPSRSNAFVVKDCVQRPSTPSEWAVLSVDSSKSLNTSCEAGGHDEAPTVRMCSLNMSRAWPLEQSWQERDSGLEPQPAAEQSEEEQSHTLLGLMERNRTSMGLSLNSDVTAKAVELVKDLITERDKLAEEVNNLQETHKKELVKDLITERDKLAEEVNNLQETHKNEKMEWHELARDLQVAVSVADRLRLEKEQAFNKLQEDHLRLQQELAEVRERQLETQREKLRNTNVSFIEDKSSPDECYEVKAHDFMENVDVVRHEEYDVNDEKDAKRSQLTARGIGKVYVDALEKKNAGAREQRRIVMSSERNISRIPLPVNSSCFKNNLNKTSSTLPLCKIEEPTRGWKQSHVLKYQDSLSNCPEVVLATVEEPHSKAEVLSYAPRLQMDVAYTKPTLEKQDEDPPLDVIKLCDVPRTQQWPRSGIKMSDLLPWCQSRTEGYQYIEICDFNDCWRDGLAFCALYHSYLPSLIPYNSLVPEERAKNLELAFTTGESVGIPATLTVDDMLKHETPDWHKVLRYIKSMYYQLEKSEESTI
ncbi:cytospin-A-like [Corythoichthys intestinalis]|uniref:cytospin-A-like n=1 Tax=Corythoichthys intestinalis TaxID=161448 RepID=UPI0025A52C15|nr:cytospin-A-like [Corythoichthys intestinalis]